MNVTFLCHCNGSLIVLVLLQEESDQTTSNGPEKMETDHRVRNQLLTNNLQVLVFLACFSVTFSNTLFFIFIFPLVKVKSFFIDSFPKT